MMAFLATYALSAIVIDCVGVQAVYSIDSAGLEAFKGALKCKTWIKYTIC